MLPVVGGAAVSDPLHERAIRRSADRKSTRLNSSHLVISYAVFFFRKKTRLNSSHLVISYAVFCLKKKKPANRPFIVTASPTRVATSETIRSCTQDARSCHHTT